PNGKMAISVQLSDPARVAGFVRPGAQVAIFLTGQPELVEPGGETRSLPQISKLLVRKVEVIGVGDTTVLSTTTTTSSGQETTEEIPKTILTLAVNQDEAERLFVSGHGGELAFALLNDKSVTQNSAGTTLNDIFVD
ncbi:MAG: RcpC/CpaB family pilus assembly protein, partial [Nocardioidaceae bacterium]